MEEPKAEISEETEDAILCNIFDIEDEDEPLAEDVMTPEEPQVYNAYNNPASFAIPLGLECDISDGALGHELARKYKSSPVEPHNLFKDRTKGMGVDGTAKRFALNAALESDAPTLVQAIETGISQLLRYKVQRISAA